MKLVFIYGPPAAGKLTVGQEIAEQTGFRLFHNHLTIELAREIFEDRKIREEVVEKLRLDVIEAAARADVSPIFTMVYGQEVDDEYVAEIVTGVERSGGAVCFVQLTPPPEELEKRVGLRSRKNFSKIKDVDTLHDVLKEHQLYGPVPYSHNLQIDNTKLSPSDAAKTIISHFEL